MVLDNTYLLLAILYSFINGNNFVLVFLVSCVSRTRNSRQGQTIREPLYSCLFNEVGDVTSKIAKLF